MTVAIVGLGQIGSSLGAAIVRRGLDRRVIGIVRRRETAIEAVGRGFVHEATTDLEAVREAGVVVLATPVRTILRQIPEVARRLRPDALLTDVGSTKAEILKAAARAKPRPSFVGGHPMAGRETPGIDACDSDLFVGRPWILLPARGARPVHVEWIETFVRRLGAKPVRMKDAGRHDAAMAFVSHLPHLAAYALVHSVDDGALDVAGRSFRDATRVAASSPDMVIDILLTNRRPIASAARRFARAVARLSTAILKREEPLLRRLLHDCRRRVRSLP